MKASDITLTVENVNLGNWSGDTITISAKSGEFSMYDYVWNIADIVYDEKWKCGYFKLFGDDWADAQTIHITDGEMTPEVILKSAIKWIANFV